MRKMMIAAALAAATAAAPAVAQVGNSQGLISVQIQDVTVLDDFLNDTQIAALNNLGVPITVQAPISVAANVCGTTVNALGALRKENSPATCNATSGSAALADIVQRQKLKQNKQ
jgi:ChpA-C